MSKNKEFGKAAAATWDRMTWGIDSWHDEVNKLEGKLYKLKSLALPCYNIHLPHDHPCSDKNYLCDACIARKILNE